jgi:hypothetical protein
VKQGCVRLLPVRESDPVEGPTRFFAKVT